jgi:hypothetical protein
MGCPEAHSGEWGRLDAAIATFVARHAHRARQRTQEWKEAKAGSVGGSEVAALMGHNRYSSFLDVVAAKAGLSVFGGNTACRWGTFFEGVIERFVALDCGTTLRGTDVSVPAPPGSALEGLHANSPDGYCVVELLPGGGGGEPRLRTGDAPGGGGRPAAVLLEFKCPLSRRPTGGVPRHYLPQLWSGLALSPPAEYGLFVDAVFRKCSLGDLGASPLYDTRFPPRRDGAPETPDPRWAGAVAWGFAAVYAPFAPEAGALVDYARAGAELARDALGAPPPGGPGAAADPVDFGECGAGLFEKALACIDGGGFAVEHVGPRTCSKQGAPLDTGREVGAALRAREAAPPGHYLLGVIPWKLLEVDYVFVERREGFLGEIEPLVGEALAAASAVRAAPDPSAAFRAFAATRRGRAGGPRPGPLHALFDAAGDDFAAGDAAAPPPAPGGPGPLHALFDAAGDDLAYPSAGNFPDAPRG